MTDNMIEKVTAAIKAEFGKSLGAKPLTPGGIGQPGDWFAQSDGSIDLSRLARAAIEAMREPTEAMMNCGRDARHDPTFNPREHYEVWHAMIEAALTDGAMPNRV